MSGGPSRLLALLPPADVAEQVQAWRKQHGVQDAAATPHITVKARSGLGAGQDWVPAAQAVAAATAPVTLTLGAAPRLFPRGRALYLPVTSPEAVALHLALLDALSPARRFGYEGPAMQPHLSLALGRRAVDLPRLLAAAEAELAELAGLSWTARCLALLRKPGPGGAYAVQECWPLGTAAEQA
ncbi:2'-5' RNA ligase family protein [Deinococcus sp. SL84]|uniref:2'-5' RNA ligase family protein n=1 Tax=Deinococcus sp. SL84 TaxID=2994663 RepID=UPI00227258A9|nr:2'-5' RNA ligase family protein [Deinococcus sp. SL84]MCY1702352.1 2'-5' RNA ligase family protein [Deinococcus sp. SL84]